MNTQHAFGILSVVCWTIVSGTVFGQTFISGSTGADGAYVPACSPTPCTVTETVVASGVYNYTTVTIPAGVTVKYVRNAANAPVTILATGDVTIQGTLNANGNNGLAPIDSGVVVNPGALGGPGGFNGGNSGVFGAVFPNAGQGPGGGLPAIATGGSGGGGNYAAPASFVALIPLFGGSGGGGGTFSSASLWNIGGSGGGGGGAVLIASSSRIVITGSITANGGDAGQGGNCGNFGGGGSGGAIRLVAGEISGPGSLRAIAGTGGGCLGAPLPSNGRVRLETFTLGFAGTILPSASQSVSPGPVNAASNPALTNLPTLAVSSVGGVATPSTPGGLFSAADVSLPQGATNPVPVIVAAMNTPVGPPTAITVKLIPQSGSSTTISVPGANHTGTFASSTANTSVTFPAGQVSLVQASATMTLTGQIASLFPLIDGEPVERVQVAAVQGQQSTLSLVTKSGKEVRVDQLTFADQLRIAQAWGAMGQARVE